MAGLIGASLLCHWLLLLPLLRCFTRKVVTAVIAGFIISALGSRVQIGGPTGAFIVIVYGIVQVHGVNGLIIATFMAGVMLVLMGFARRICH
jgi:hypothetical protein